MACIVPEKTGKSKSSGLTGYGRNSFSDSGMGEPGLKNAAAGRIRGSGRWQVQE